MSPQGQKSDETPWKRDTTRRASELKPREFLRWIWRQLTSMRTALFLLLLLALAAVPGSLYPQRGVNPQEVDAYLANHTTSGPFLDKLGMFSVYSSPWFSAIYLLLMISLVGCIVPRTFVYARALRARPPRAPRNFARFPQSTTLESSLSVGELLDVARPVLGRARVDRVEEGAAGELRAERGYLREAGNLVFHVCLIVVLLGVASSSLFGYRGDVIISEGQGFSNVLTQYNNFSSGALYNTDDLDPFSFHLKKFTAKFQLTGAQRGAPREFRATGTYKASPSSGSKTFDFTVNHPLNIDGTNVFLIGQGYAPVIKVTDKDGDVAFDGPVPFLPSDGTYTSTGVVKVPDAQPDQLGFQGFFLPTAVSVGAAAPISAFPAAANPLLGLFAYHGNLGLDNGTPQSVYVLDKTHLTQYMTKGGKPLRISLSPGQETKLPDGGTIQFVELRQFVKFQISHSPWLGVPLWGISLGVLGLMVSLTIKPRRTWVRARREGSRTVVEVAVLDRVPRGDPVGDFDELVTRLKTAIDGREAAQKENQA